MPLNIHYAKSIIGHSVRRCAHLLGIEVSRHYRAGTTNRPVGKFRSFLEDLRSRGYHPQFILDVGANRGEWTRLAKTIWPLARCLLLEPLVEMRPHLQQLNEEYPDVDWLSVGAGAEDGTLWLNVTDDFYGSSFLRSPADSPTTSLQERRVPVRTVDAILAEREIKTANLVKLDVQGFELEVLKGGAALFGRTELFVVEVSLYAFHEGTPLVSDVVEFMAQRGYELYDVAAALRRPSDGALGQLDLVFAAATGELRRSLLW